MIGADRKDISQVIRRRQLAINTAAGSGANLVKLLVQVLLLPFMARLLGPTEFGLYALVLPTVSLLSILADGGLGMSLAREDASSHTVWSSAFWFLLVTGVGLFIFVSLWGVVLAHITRQPQIASVMTLLATSFVFITLSVVPLARLVQSGNTVVASAADVSSFLIGAIVAVVLAVYGAGVWSLAVQYLTNIIVRAVMLNLASSYSPRMEFNMHALKPHFSTGGSIVGSRLAEFSGRAVENFIYGRIFGASALGAYTFANQVPRFVCEAANNPVYDALYTYALKQNVTETGPLQNSLSRLVGMLIFPASALLIGSAPATLNILLGPKWHEAIPLLQILMMSYAFSVIASQGSALLYASGKNSIVFWNIVVLWILRIAAVTSGYFVGAVFATGGVAFANVLFATSMFVISASATRSSVLSIMRSLSRPFCSSVAGGLVCYFSLRQSITFSLGNTMGSIVAGLLTYSIVLIVIDGKTIREDFFATSKLLRPKKEYF